MTVLFLQINNLCSKWLTLLLLLHRIFKMSMNYTVMETKFVVFFFSSIRLCLIPHPPRPRKRKKEKKKINNSYALYLISKIICDRPFFPFFTCITYWIDRLRDDVILLLLPKSFRDFLPCGAFLILNFTGLTNVLIKEKTEWIPVLDVHTGASSCRWSILTPGKKKSVMLDYCFGY